MAITILEDYSHTHQMFVLLSDGKEFAACIKKPNHNGHKNAEIMHFRSEKVGSVRQFQLFLLIMHYLETTKPTVQVDIPF